MIIQALNEYYLRLKKNSDSKIPPFGFSREKIHFALILDQSGKRVDVKDLRGKEGKKIFPEELIVPAGDERIPGLSISRASGTNPHFLWDNAGYILGTNNKKFNAFKIFQYMLGEDVQDKGMQAVLNFLAYWDPKQITKLKYFNEMDGSNIVFKLEGERKYIHESSIIKGKWLKYCKGKQSEYINKTFCLGSGQKEDVVRLHPGIKGMPHPAQSSGTSIVSFNLNSFCSYNKKQNFNSPVSKEIAFNYTTALNHLLRYESRQKIQIGDSTIVFWTEGPNPIEGFLKDILDPQKNQASSGDTRRFLEAMRDGEMPKEIESTKDVKFYILGLSPNASRLSIRFWHVDKVENIYHNIEQHFKDLTIIRNYDYDKELEFPGIWHLLHELAPQREIGKLSPLFAGLYIKAIITGGRYPSNLLAVIINRIRAEQSLKNKKTGKPIENVTYSRAAMIKAYLVRNWRFQNKKEREVINLSLNKEEKNTGYRLGRLFAILEKAQKDAILGIRATIKDRFYGSASATPSVVFPQLLRLSQHHIQKSTYGINIDKQIEDIVKDIRSFPSHLSLEDQGLFALGYYHQKRDFFNKVEKKEE